jgi:hypothetical protein
MSSLYKTNYQKKNPKEERLLLTREAEQREADRKTKKKTSKQVFVRQKPPHKGAYHAQRSNWW